MACTIYGLIDPRTSELRYIGKTKLAVNQRLYRHFCETANCYRVRWMKSLRRFGRVPEIVVLEVVEDSEWATAERFWIAYFRFLGSRLTNLTDGGEGRENGRNSQDAIDRMRRSKIGKKITFSDPEARAKKIAAAVTGRTVSEETRQKLRAANLGKRTASTAAKIDEILRLAAGGESRIAIAARVTLDRHTVGSIIAEFAAEQG